MRLLESLTKFADDSSIHGLNYIAKSPSKTERIIWFILFTGALLYAGLQIGEEYRGKTYFLFFAHSGNSFAIFPKPIIIKIALID